VDYASERLAWGFGCVLTGAAVNFFCSPYYDQITTVLYMFLAMIACVVEDAGVFRPARSITEHLHSSLPCTNGIGSETAVFSP